MKNLNNKTINCLMGVLLSLPAVGFAFEPQETTVTDPVAEAIEYATVTVPEVYGGTYAEHVQSGSISDLSTQTNTTNTTTTTNSNTGSNHDDDDDDHQSAAIVSDPWAGYDQEYGEFGNPQDLADHQEAIQAAIATSDQICGQSCDDIDRYQILNTNYYSELAKTGNQNLPIGPVETMHRYNSPDNQLTDAIYEMGGMTETEDRMDKMVRMGDLSVILPGQTMNTVLNQNPDLSPLQKLSIQTTPIFVGSTEAINQTFQLRPNDVAGMQYGAALPYGGGYGGSFFIVSNTTSPNGQPMLDLDGNQEHLETILHEANHSGELALASLMQEMIDTNQMSQMQNSANDSDRLKADVIQSAGETALAMLFIQEEPSTIQADDCPTCFLIATTPEGKSPYLNTLTEIRARLSEGTSEGVETWVKRLQQEYPISEAEARNVVNDLMSSENLKNIDEVIQNGAKAALQFVGNE